MPHNLVKDGLGISTTEQESGPFKSSKDAGCIMVNLTLDLTAKQQIL